MLLGFRAETGIQSGCTQRFSRAARRAKAFPRWTVPKYRDFKCFHNNINITATAKHNTGESEQGERDLFELNQEQSFFFQSGFFGQ